MPARLLCLLALLHFPPVASQFPVEQQIAAIGAGSAPLRPLWYEREGPGKEAAAAAASIASGGAGASSPLVAAAAAAAAFAAEHGADGTGSGGAGTGSTLGPGVHVKRQHSALQCPLLAGSC